MPHVWGNGFMRSGCAHRPRQRNKTKVKSKPPVEPIALLGARALEGPLGVPISPTGPGQRYRWDPRMSECQNVYVYFSIYYAATGE